MKVVLISDTHSQMDKVTLPEGDILIHAGDHSYQGSITEMSKALKQLADKGKNFKKIIAICGNHDWLGETHPTLMKQLCEDNGITYLQDDWVLFEGKVIYGSAWQPEFCDWAFNVPRGPKIAEKWALIPDKVDILITHGPVYGILDNCPDGERVGCEELYKRVVQVRPELHVCGHIHNAYGIYHFDGITFVNASTCDEQYMPLNKPIVIDL